MVFGEVLIAVFAPGEKFKIFSCHEEMPPGRKMNAVIPEKLEFFCFRECFQRSVEIKVLRIKFCRNFPDDRIVCFDQGWYAEVI